MNEMQCNSSCKNEIIFESKWDANIFDLFHDNFISIQLKYTYRFIQLNNNINCNSNSGMQTKQHLYEIVMSRSLWERVF